MRAAIRNALIFGFALAILAAAQEDLRVDVRLVNIYATVIDSSGRYVQGLKKTDFIVEEGGRRQSVSHFDQNADTPVSVGIVIDTSESMRLKLDTAIDAVRQFARTVARSCHHTWCELCWPSVGPKNSLFRTFLVAIGWRRRMLMGFKELVSKAEKLTGSASDAAGKLLDELNEALPTMRALGFTLKDLRVGMGVLPEIGAKLIASTDTLDVKKIKELIDKNADKNLLVAALKGLELAYNVKQQIGDLPFKGVELDFTLGLPPHVGVQFVGSTPSTASEATAARA